jgi:hypothetical protein
VSKNVKQITNVVLPAIALAIGIAVIVLTIVDDNIATKDLIRMLAIATFSLSLFALNKRPKEK